MHRNMPDSMRVFTETSLSSFVAAPRGYIPAEGFTVSKILLIEDDNSLATFLVRSLKGKLFDVDHVTDGDSGLHWLRTQYCDLAIVDWDLPKLSGVDVCRSYRAAGGSAPILMLTGKGTTNDKVVGLDAGADDYLPKPFDFPELHARLRALLRRKDKEIVDSTSISHGNIHLNLDSCEVSVAGQLVPVTLREFRILEVLIRNPNHIMGMEAIIARAWPSDSESSPEVLRVHITRLRQKLGKCCPELADCIKSVYGLGYKFEQAVKTVQAE